MIVSYFFFFMFQIKKKDLGYGKLFLNWLLHSVIFTVIYLLVHGFSISIFQMINYRWYSDMVGAELIVIFPGVIIANILILIIRIVKKSLRN